MLEPELSVDNWRLPKVPEEDGWLGSVGIVEVVRLGPGCVCDCLSCRADAALVLEYNRLDAVVQRYMVTDYRRWKLARWRLAVSNKASLTK